jgi:hypothetical protein
MNLLRRTAILAAAALVGAGTWSGVVYADSSAHYYIEIGGTGANADAPACTITYGYANESLNGGIPVPVCYPASAGPFLDGTDHFPAPTAPSYDSSVKQGVANTLTALEDKYHADPGATFTIVGYSQGAQVADEALATIANGDTDVPTSQVDGMLYGDPMQPGTGVWSVVPKGWSLFGFTSTGPGMTEFNGIPVERYCIHHDLACDATTLQSIPGFLFQHPKYPDDNGIIEQTIAHDGGDGITWYDPDQA